MEKGKKMEFRKATKIVILAIVISAIIGIAAVEATTYSVTDCPKCPDSGLKFWNGEDSLPNYLGCSYFTSVDPFISGNEGHIAITEHDSREEAVNDFEEIRKWAKTEHRDKILKDNQIELVFMAKGFVDFEIHGYFLHIDKKIITHVNIRRRGISNDDREEAKTMFQEFAKCAHSITGWKSVPILSETEKKYVLTLKHYESYYEPEDGIPWRAGDLVARLTDKDGNGVSGKIIFFCITEGNLGEALLSRMVLVKYADIFDSSIYPTIRGSYIGHDYTNERGYASTNYLRDIRPERLSEIIRETRENVRGTITVVDYDEKTKDIGRKASVNIELSGIARMTTILVRDKDEKGKDKRGTIFVEKPNKEIIPVYDKDYISKHKLSKIAKRTPYNLLSGDIILLNENDCIDVCWLTGTKMKITVKTGVLEEHESAKVHIGPDDIGWYEWVNQKTKSSTAHAINIGPAAITLLIQKISRSPISGSVLASFGVVKAFAFEFFAVGFRHSDDYRNPLVIEPYSTILIDLDKTATVYTVEGTGRVHNIKDNSATNVTTGHKISLLPDGTFSQVSEFDRSELNEDLSYLLESIEKDESETIVAPVLTPEQSKLEISKLYVEKPVYPRKTEVDVQYHIKNIGTVDVDEYHVEYKINDFKGNEVYKFVGSTHSIASGKQQKFIAAEKWEIPSDARIGPYIIDCTLIWDSKKDTAGREFFVTHPAKREDRTAELEISNLYTGKSEYLEGAGERVDVCYYVKNIGTVDISEYHVIYQIFDSEGKRYCWFISDMFGSIVAGKEDKWQSGGWKVPSDAKVGRYTVDAMVIWGLDRFSRETAYFFVN